MFETLIVSKRSNNKQTQKKRQRSQSATTTAHRVQPDQGFETECFSFGDQKRKFFLIREVLHSKKPAHTKAKDADQLKNVKLCSFHSSPRGDLKRYTQLFFSS
jgi:hypothetical protein